MSEFPRLKTGAAVQYPAKRTQRYSTHVLRFLDGGEQRYREYPAPLVRWEIALEQLSDEEMEALERFFLSEQANYGSFPFTDPWDGTTYPNCRLENPDAYFEFRDLHDGRVRLTVSQNR